MRNKLAMVTLCGTLLLAVFGCKKTADNTVNYKNAIDTYYAVHPTCIWPQPVQLPVQTDSSDPSRTSQYDALFDDGLLNRTTGEKKVMIVATRKVTNYDLSDQGRNAWTPDPDQPGYGNFCYGHRTVQSITSSTPNSGTPGATTEVEYLYSFTGVPSWAQNQETQTAFPQVETQINGHGASSATLVDTANGWQMKQPPSTGASNPDSQIQ